MTSSRRTTELPTRTVSSAITVTANVTTYVEADPTTGAVGQNTSGFTPGKVPLYTVIAGPSSISDYIDQRVVIADFAKGTVVSVSWKLAPEEINLVSHGAVLHATVRWLAVVSVLFFPFMPGKMAELWERLGSGRDTLPSFNELATLDVSGWKTSADGILFPRPEVPAAA